jgi:DNA-binding LytR/AlgR family response regulator
MDHIECIVVDDEPLAILQMKDYLERLPGFILKASFTKGLEALTYLQSDAVDLLFLDIQMDDISGIQVLEAMKARPVVIMTTAYEKYALKGYELDVCDYLLKPISFDRFLKATFKAGKMISAYRQAVREDETPVRPDEDQHHIYVKSGTKLCRINLNEVLYFEGCGDYLKIQTAGSLVLTPISFRKLSAMLPPGEFIRVHRSYMIAVNRIQSIDNRWITIGGKKVPIGDYYRKVLFNLLPKA